MLFMTGSSQTCSARKLKGLASYSKRRCCLYKESHLESWHKWLCGSIAGALHDVSRQNLGLPAHPPYRSVLQGTSSLDVMGKEQKPAHCSNQKIGRPPHRLTSKHSLQVGGSNLHACGNLLPASKHSVPSTYTGPHPPVTSLEHACLICREQDNAYAL